jgi:hypothetical protein
MITQPAKTTSDIAEARTFLQEEPGMAFGCVMGQRDWREIVCRLDPHLFGCTVGKIGPVHVALDRSMQPTESRWYYLRSSFEEHLGRIPR